MSPDGRLDLTPCSQNCLLSAQIRRGADQRRRPGALSERSSEAASTALDESWELGSTRRPTARDSAGVSRLPEQLSDVVVKSPQYSPPLSRYDGTLSCLVENTVSDSALRRWLQLRALRGAPRLDRSRTLGVRNRRRGDLCALVPSGKFSVHGADIDVLV